MGKYEFSNCQIGAAGDKAVAYGTVFKNGLGLGEEIDLEALKREITELKTFIETKESKNVEEYKLLSDVVEIEEYVYKDDKEKLINKINTCASKLFYTLATGTGTGVLANIISKALGI